MLNTMGHQALYLGRPEQALLLARTAQRNETVAPVAAETAHSVLGNHSAGVDVSEEQRNHCGDRSVFSRDLDDEGEPEAEFHPGIAQRLPRKNVASGALIRDDAGRVLFVSPTYKPFLEIPGGLTEDDESPQAGCQREIYEELGIRVTVGKLLLVD